MISINIKIHPGMKQFLSKGMTQRRFEISLPDDSTLEHLLNDKVGLPEDLPKLIVVNGIHASLSQKLKQDDRVSIFMPTAGG